MAAGVASDDDLDTIGKHTAEDRAVLEMVSVDLSIVGSKTQRLLYSKTATPLLSTCTALAVAI